MKYDVSRSVHLLRVSFWSESTAVNISSIYIIIYICGRISLTVGTFEGPVQSFSLDILDIGYDNQIYTPQSPIFIYVIKWSHCLLFICGIRKDVLY